MRSFRNIHPCGCSVYDVYGYFVDIGPQQNSMHLTGLSAQRVPSVLASFVNANCGIAAGTSPTETGGKLFVEIPWSRIDPQDPEIEQRRVYGVLGSRAFRDGDKQYVAYLVTEDSPIEATAWSESGISVTQICVIDVEGESIVHNFYLPEVNPAAATPHRYAEYVRFANWSNAPTFPAACVGITRNWIVLRGYNESGKLPTIQRHNLSTGHSLLGTVNAFTSGVVMVRLPAQLSDDSLPWVIAVRDGSYEIHTGVWLNNQGGDLVDVDEPTVLLENEVRNRLDNRTGYPTPNVDPDDFVAYTRRDGKDFAVLRFGNDYHWFDGFQNRWYMMLDVFVYNIYAASDGESVILQCHDGVRRMIGDQVQWHFPAECFSHWSGSLSGNEKWIYCGGAHVTVANFPNGVRDLNTANIFAQGNPQEFESGDHFAPQGEGTAVSWGLSLETGDGGLPRVAFVHREYDWRNKWERGVTGSYLNRHYTNKKVWQWIGPDGEGGEPGEAKHPLTFTGILAMSFDAAPGCKCGCCGAGQNVNSIGI